MMSAENFIVVLASKSLLGVIEVAVEVKMNDGMPLKPGNSA